MCREVLDLGLIGELQLNTQRKPIIAANWKMYKTVTKARQMVRRLKQLLSEPASHVSCEVVLCPPFTALEDLQKEFSDSVIRLGGQNVHWEEEGAYTGEISANMLLDCGCQYVLIGHSERRQYFFESDQIVSQKLRKILTTSLIPILCVGESLEERETNRVQEIIESQLSGATQGVDTSELGSLVVAYEPVWAIGTGRTATPQIANQVHGIIRNWLAEHSSNDLAETVRVLYGGSVKPSNIRELMGQNNIDGALVGGASLDADSFARIVQFE